MTTVAEISGPKADVQPPSVQASNAARIEDLGRAVQAYYQLTENLQQSHTQLQKTVQSLRNELSEKNRQLERKKRLAALGEMAAGMAHEIRNPLGGIELYASSLARDLQELPASLELVNKISSGVKRLEGLVSQVLQFSREISPQLVKTDLASLVDQSLELAADRIGPGVVHRAVGPRPMFVRIDPLLMGQAILNLTINAVEAVGGCGSIDIVWSPLESDGKFHLSIRDTGPGIAPAVLDRIFNPFFTTKETGTGLGLAIVYRIVEAHDGTITAANAPQGGAIFEIRT
ncbi:MAG TPA: ATP-binding protein [Tepidisphaeraceae bacterium]|jgi:signal transduction histidine kinase|nr:ATP-binding protein [Tepidisphaeraceae bacterium]